uniref:Uncharacterized protein n=1 Tax=Anguilla anguilla TaxID=7936 RepID=A0A0E9PF79_ANGAN
MKYDLLFGMNYDLPLRNSELDG